MIALGSAADGGLLSESHAIADRSGPVRERRSFVAREVAIALLRLARECSIYRALAEPEREADWRDTIESLRAASHRLGDHSAIICARAKCSPEQCACVLAAAVVAFDRWLTIEGRQ